MALKTFDDFCVVVTVATEEVNVLDGCLTSVRKAYPKIKIHVIADGNPEPLYKAVAVKHSANYTLGRYLKRAECGGLWWKRFLEVGLGYKKGWIIKLDPDSRFHRPFVSSPQHDLAGTLSSVGLAHENVQGGCQAIRRSFAEKIIKSKSLDSAAWRNQWLYCPDGAMMRSWTPAGYFSTDFSIMHLVRKLGATVGNWSEVRSLWKHVPDNPNNRFAVTHPCVEKAPREGVHPSTTLHVIIPCMGRLGHLKKTLPLIVAEPNVHVTVVDWSCPDKTGDWIKKNLPAVNVVSIAGKHEFNLSAARNAGAKSVISKLGSVSAWLGFLDADMEFKPGWSVLVRKKLRANHYHIPQPLEYGMTGTCFVESHSYAKAGGYDEVLRGWGGDDIDFYMRLRQVNCRPWSWPGNLAKPLQHSDAERTRFYHRKNRTESNKIAKEYFRLKVAWIILNWKLPDYATRMALMAEATVIVEGQPIYAGFDSSFKHPQVEDNHPLITGGAPSSAPKRIEVPVSPAIMIGSIDKSSIKIDGTMPLSSSSSIQSQPSFPSGSALPKYLSVSGSLKGTGMNISVVNKSNLHLGYTLDELVAIGNNYLAKIVQPLWGVNATLIATKEILPHTHAIILMDDPAHNSILGYRTHTPDGLPLTQVYTKTTLTAAKSITHIFTAEVAEFVVDPGLNHSSVAPDGTVYAREISGPVEENAFMLDGEMVSDVVTPAWFEGWHKNARVDFAGIISQPFQIADGGIALVRSKDGQWVEKPGSVLKGQRTTVHFPDYRHSTRIAQYSASQQHAHLQYLK